MKPVPDAELVEMARRVDAATPKPWHVRFLDDDYAMNLVAVSTLPDTGRGERWPDFDNATIVAATLHERQQGIQERVIHFPGLGPNVGHDEHVRQCAIFARHEAAN